MVKITTNKILGYVAGLSLCMVSLLPIAAAAVADSDSTTINASLGSIISVSAGGSVVIGVTPAASGTMSSASDTVFVSTNNAAGYYLTLSNGDTNTNLANGSDTIAAHNGSQASPSSLNNNSWGYRVDGEGGFGAGPTAAEANIGSSAYSWAGVPSSAAPNTIKSVNGAVANDETKVWYGVRVDQSLPTGTYTDSVTYTATTN